MHLDNEAEVKKSQEELQHQMKPYFLISYG